MATAPDQSILDALRGYTVESTKQPTPRLVKIYISSSKHGEWEDGRQATDVSCLHKCFFIEFTSSHGLFISQQNSKKNVKCYSKSSDQNCNRFTMTNKLRFVKLRLTFDIVIKSFLCLCRLKSSICISERD